jgi:hypothetical protein
MSPLAPAGHILLDMVNNGLNFPPAGHILVKHFLFLSPWHLLVTFWLTWSNTLNFVPSDTSWSHFGLLGQPLSQFCPAPAPAGHTLVDLVTHYLNFLPPDFNIVSPSTSWLHFGRLSQPRYQFCPPWCPYYHKQKKWKNCDKNILVMLVMKPWHP